MGKHKIYILDITSAGHTNGVDRYISCLLSGLTRIYPPDRLFHIRFVVGSREMTRRVESPAGYCRVSVPLPERFGTIISEVYWSNKFNEVLYNCIKFCFQDDSCSLLHVHTLNLIDLALEIKKHVPAHIITHLHCTPWKNLYNDCLPAFNRFYIRYYLERNYQEKYYTNHSEEPAYKQSDRIIACTACGRSFVRNISGVPEAKIAVLSNGIADLYSGCGAVSRPANTPFRLLFVGSVVVGKGIFFILEALRKVIAAGFAVELVIAGAGSDVSFDCIRRQFSDVPVRILGSVPFEQLQEHYKSCDLGIIGSVQEQNSYVAIEMAMFGMPIVTTAVDGLDEMFTDGVDAWKIPVPFDRLSGLRVDTDAMGRAVIELLSSPEKRAVLSQGARRLYEEKYTLPRMIEQIVQIYTSLTQTENHEEKA